jgi:hypothetical protein
VKIWRFKARPHKKFTRLPSQPIKKLGAVIHTCHPNFSGGINRRIVVQAGPDIKARYNSKK